MRSHWPRKLIFVVSTVLAAGLVLLAVAVILLHVLVAQAPALRGEAETLLAEVLGRPVALGGLDADWSERQPVLTLRQLELGGDDALAGLEIEALDVRVDLIGSLLALQPRVAELAVSGVQAHMLREPDGRFRLRLGKLWLTELERGEGGGLPALPATVRVRDAGLLFEDRLYGGDYRIQGAEFILGQTNGFFAFSGELPLPGSLGEYLRFRAEWPGMPTARESVHGRLYLKGEGLQLAGLQALVPEQVPELEGRANLQVWADLAAGQVAAATVSVETGVARIGGTRLERLAGRLAWERRDDGWRLTGDGIEVERVGVDEPPGQLLVEYRQEAEGSALRGGADYIPVQDVVAVAHDLGILPETAEARLQELSPRGLFRNPRGALRWQDGALTAYRFQARFEGMGIEPINSLPGFEGVGGRLYLNEEGGIAALGGRGGSIVLPRLFRGPLPFGRAGGRVAWRRDPQGWRIEAPRLRLRSDDGEVSARARIFLSEDGPFLDMRAHLINGDGGALSRYLPVGIMHPRIVEWLDRAIGGGQVPEADFLFFGPARNFPFDDNSGVFHVIGDVQQGQLAYFPGWPAVSDVSAELSFRGRAMRISADRGRMYDAEVRRARVVIENLLDPVVEIDGEVSAEGSDYLRFLSEAPLTSGLRDIWADFRLTGRHDLDLGLAIPIRGGEPQVAGRVMLHDAGFSMPRLQLAIDAINGELRFDARGMYADGLSGSYLGQPVKFLVATHGEGERARIYVDTDLEAGPDRLWAGAELPYLRGQARYHLEAVFPGFRSGAKTVRFGLASDMRGAAIELPAPLGKSEGEIVPLHLGLRVGPDGLEPLSLRYGERLQALIGFGEGGAISGASVHLGAASGELAAPNGYRISGRLDTLDIGAWTPVARDLIARRDAATGSTAAAVQVPAVDAAAEVEIGRLQVLGQRFDSVLLGLERVGQAWQLELAAPAVAGLLRRHDDGRLELDLQRLYVGGGDGGAAAASEHGGAGFEPVGLPPLAVNIEHLTLGSMPLGRLGFVTEPQPDGVRLDEGQLQSGAFTANFSGRWVTTGEGTRSEADFRFDSINLGRALDAFGYEGAIRGGVAEGRGTLTWPGGPAAFDVAQLSGDFEFDARAGQILQVEPGAGRLFGLLSIAALPRRLSLDFSDLFGRGFAFDEIQGRFDLNEGDARTRLFYMTGPAARVDLDGRIGLASRDYNLRVSVTPRVSSALPAVGALTAGPAGAVVFFLTQQLLDKEIDRLTRYRYRVTGNWDDPDIESAGESEGATSERAPTAPEIVPVK